MLLSPTLLSKHPPVFHGPVNGVHGLVFSSRDHRPSYSPLISLLAFPVGRLPFQPPTCTLPAAVPSIENAIMQLAAPPASLISEDATAVDSLGYRSRRVST